MKLLYKLAITLVLLHLVVSVPHGMAHSELHIEMQLWQNVYIWLIITILPIVAAILLWRRRRAGFLLLLLSMAGSFLFGVFYHFIAAGSDNVATLPVHAAAGTFRLTAVLLALIEAVGFVIGLLGWLRSPQS
jgi:hypothetical protein